VIRPATPDDLPVIAQLIRELAEYERLADKVVLDEARLGEHLFGPRPYAEVLLAEDAGAVVGLALFFHNYSTFGGRPGIYLEDLFVRPAARGKGLGKALLLALARLAVERDCCKVEWSVLNWNEPSIRFYESLGAKSQDEWTVYRLDAAAITRLGGAG
jgi:GNAT superfamily N-acetyltransferase